jgi:hypothetical protein
MGKRSVFSVHYYSNNPLPLHIQHGVTCRALSRCTRRPAPGINLLLQEEKSGRKKKTSCQTILLAGTPCTSHPQGVFLRRWNHLYTVTSLCMHHLISDVCTWGGSSSQAVFFANTTKRRRGPSQRSHERIQACEPYSNRRWKKGRQNWND